MLNTSMIDKDLFQQTIDNLKENGQYRVCLTTYLESVAIFHVPYGMVRMLLKTLLTGAATTI